MARPVLDLTTLASPIPSTVMIDGQPYPLTSPDMLSVLAYKRIDAITTRMRELWTSETVSAEQEAEVSQLCDALCRVVLQAPAEVHDRLTDIQRIAVYNAFQTLPQVSLRLVEANSRRPATIPTTGPSRRGSRGSTAAIRSGGSSRRQSA